ncbi:unnamed protein product [Ectocarpus sp. CCAP 1310/34]|nr:unnamed protein product [Ectocarpus sp. CCAP 1310/34]
MSREQPATCWPKQPSCRRTAVCSASQNCARGWAE